MTKASAAGGFGGRGSPPFTTFTRVIAAGKRGRPAAPDQPKNQTRPASGRNKRTASSRPRRARASRRRAAVGREHEQAAWHAGVRGQGSPRVFVCFKLSICLMCARRCGRVRRMSEIAGNAFVYWASGRNVLEIRRPYYCTGFVRASEWQNAVTDCHEFLCFFDELSWVEYRA